MRVTNSRLVLVKHLIGWEGGTSFLDQSESEVKQNHCNPRLLWTFETTVQIALIYSVNLPLVLVTYSYV